jgi:hypothetical protein
MNSHEIRQYLDGMSKTTEEPCVEHLGKALQQWAKGIPDSDLPLGMRVMLQGVVDTAETFLERL